VARLGLVSAVALVVGLATAGKTEAGIMIYTLSGGSIDGTLNGTSFTITSFTIMATADTAGITTGTFSRIALYQHLNDTSTISNDGFAPTVFSESGFGAYSINFNNVIPGSGIIGFLS